MRCVDRPAAGQAVEQGPRRAARRSQQLAGRRGAAHADGAARRLGHVPSCARWCTENKGKLALESLWALYVSGGFDEDFAAQLLDHPNEDVRTWTIRLLGDGKKVSPGFRDRLVALARTEKSPTVRCQLACSAKRLPGPDCLAIVRELLRRDEDADDPFIPMLLWWAIEDKAITDRDATHWACSTRRRRGGRRSSAGSSSSGWPVATWTRAARPTCRRAPACWRRRRGRRRRTCCCTASTNRWKAAGWRRRRKSWKSSCWHCATKRPDNLTLLRLAVRLGGADAYEQAVQRAGDAKAPDADRIALIDLLGQTGKPDCVPMLLQALTEAKTRRRARRPS